MLYATAEANAAAVQAILPQFEAATGIELVLDTQPYDALQQRVFAEFASNSTFYDIVIVDTPWAPALVDRLEPLGEYLEDESLNDLADADIGDYIPKVLYDTAVYDAGNPVARFPDTAAPGDVGAIKGEGFDVYGLPLQANALVMAYRKDLFEDPAQQAAYREQYGTDLKVPATLEEYAQVARFFTQPDKNLYGTTVMAGVGDWATDDFKSLLAAYGGNGTLVGDELSLDFNSPEGVEALTYYRDLIASGAVPPGSTSASWDEAAASFGGGLTAMTMNYHQVQLDEGVDGEIGFAPVPQGVTSGPHFGTWMLSLNANGQNKAWAYRAAAWLTASDQQLAMTENQLHPSRTSVYDEVSGENAEEGPTTEFYDVLGQSLAQGQGRARLTNYMEVSQAIAVAVNRAASGVVEPAEALAEAERNVRTLLEQAGYEVPASS
ncbi:extracellular solute-binding protein [Cellulomonas fimi]|uniref:Extracellular solute-binding protein n=1 Tax=Cellulomonas fimi TaxID=1708 RepID=A0A7Y0M130_CELFI|nr:extracellular solute-binding protein [Cellulomonas fimi]NMR21484.1 extracellular solute-binding protein [Cellulomonas fimi]